MFCMKKNQIMLDFLIIKLIRRIEGYYSLNVENGIIDVVHSMLLLRYIIFTNSDYHEETDF